MKIARIPYIQEWREVFECDHDLCYCLDPGDGLGTHIEDGDGITVLDTTEADAGRVMNEFETTLDFGGVS